MRVEETIQREILEQRIDMELEALTKRLFGCTVEEATDRQVYVALLYPFRRSSSSASCCPIT